MLSPFLISYPVFAVGKMAMREVVSFWTVVLLSLSAVLAHVEDLDDTFKDNRKDEIWLVEFYAPWCGYCKKLEPVWAEIGADLKRVGSSINVGKMDATAYSSVASEFGVRGYPTIKLLKGDLAYNYRGPRTKEDIIEFANRVAGPVVQPLPSKQMFEQVLNQNKVLFVYVGGESTLKEKFLEVASELIVYTYFFSAPEDSLPSTVTLQELPSVAVFKDGTYFLYDAYQDGELSTWVSKERFQGYLHIDGFTLYELGDTGKLVAIAVVDEKNATEESDRYKALIQRVASEYRDQFSRHIQFGHMDGSEYINGLVMGEVTVPSIIVLNTSNNQYFVPGEPIDDFEQLIQFMNSVLDGVAQAQGGDGVVQRVKRLFYDSRATVMAVFRSSRVLGCVLFGLPLGIISLMCYGMCAAESDDGSSDMELLKREQEQEDRRHSEDMQDSEDEEEDEEEEGEEKSVMEKKDD